MVVLVGLACGAVGVGLAALVYERQLRRMARDLRERDAHSNTRLTVEAPGRGFAELAAAVNRQLDAAQEERLEGRRRQQEFQRDLASLSHDIRTPLMGAKGYLRLAQDEDARNGGVECGRGDASATMFGDERESALVNDCVHAGNDAGKSEAPPASNRARRLRAAEARLDDMGALLDQLFAYAQASDPDLALDLRPVRVLPLLADVLVGQYPAFERHGWEPQVDLADEGLLVEADPEALTRIFENLVGNALRHGASAPIITQRGNVVTFANEVADPSALDVDRLFERFYRADASRTRPGSGLGLAISTNLATAMEMHLSAHLSGKMLSINLALPDYDGVSQGAGTSVASWQQ